MRNLKKILALALAVVMTFSLMTVAGAAFSDSGDINPDYQAAAEVLEGLGAYKGQKDASGNVTFAPKADITRAEVAAVVYRIMTGDVEDKQVGIYADYNTFADVPSTAWYAGYVNFCATAGLIKGVSADGKTFNPTGNIDGYSAVALILRAIGYGKNGEFEGKEWRYNTSTTAQALGILKNINSGTLGVNASREMVAEIIFQGIAYVPTVTYTPALGYNKYNGLVGNVLNDTLGWKTFKLAVANGVNDPWGRPSTIWYKDQTANATQANSTYNRGDIVVATFSNKADATYTVAVDECDIAEDLGLSQSTPISSCWINGYEWTGAASTTNNRPITDKRVVSKGDGNIDPLDTTSVVGAQGRVTEVYDMGDGTIRLVEIDTWLARVTKVNESVVDKNGHPSIANVVLDVYYAVDGNTNGYGQADEHDNFGNTIYPNTTTNNYLSNVVVNNATGFTVGQYVLVNMFQPGAVSYDKDGRVVTAATAHAYYGLPTTSYAENVRAAKQGTSGVITNWTDENVTAANGVTPATTVINGETTYKDSDKFIEGWRNTTDTSRVAYLDEYDNIIGFVVPDSNWLVIEKTEWKHHSTGIGGGWALADAILATGEQVKDITIASVNGIPSNNTYDTAGTPATANFSDDYTNNGEYYHHFFSYYVGIDGRYYLTEHDAPQTNLATSPTGGVDFVHSTYTVNPDTTKTYHGAVYTGVATIELGTGTVDGTSTIIGGSSVNNVVANNNTIFLVWNQATYSYAVYKGIDAVPSVENAQLCIMRNAKTGYAQLVLVNGTSQNLTVAYVPVVPAVGTTTISVYPLGSNRATTLKIDAAQLAVLARDGAGLYAFQVKGNTIAVNPIKVANDVATIGGVGAQHVAAVPGIFITGKGYADGLYYDRTVVSNGWETGSEAGASFKVNANNVTAVPGSVAPVKDFRVTNETRVIVVDSNNRLAIGSLADIKDGSQVIVGYTATRVGTVSATYRYVAQYVYVFKPAAAGNTTVIPTSYVFDATNGASFRFDLGSGDLKQISAGVYDLRADITIYNVDRYGNNGVVVFKGNSDNVAVNVVRHLMIPATPLAPVTLGGFTVTTMNTLSAGEFYYAEITLSGTTDTGRTFVLNNWKSGVRQAQDLVGTTPGS